jgi:hypothetical protein
VRGSGEVSLGAHEELGCPREELLDISLGQNGHDVVKREDTASCSFIKVTV